MNTCRQTDILGPETATPTARQSAAKGTSWGRLIARMLGDCFPVWADSPPYESHHRQTVPERRKRRFQPGLSSPVAVTG